MSGNIEPHQLALDKLHHLLKHLPDSIPESTLRYPDFSQYFADPEHVADFGSEQGALNRDLEVTFGSRHAGPIQFKERGASLESVVLVLRRYIDGKSPEEALLVQWIEDLTAAAVAVYLGENLEIPEMSVKRASKPSKKRAAVKEEKEEVVQLKKTKVDTKAQEEEAAKRTAQDVAFDFEDLADDQTGPYTKGRRSNSLLDKFTIPCHSKSKPDAKARFRCSATGCHTSWAEPRQSARVLKHAASECRYMEPELKSEALKSSAKASLGRQLQASSNPDEEATNELPISSSTSKKHSGGQPSVAVAVKKEGRKQTNLQLNFNVLRLICAAMLPPSIVDYPEWKTIFSDIDSSLHCLSSTSFSENFIPKEAANARESSISTLQKSRHLTISLDGGTTRRCQSIYTVHVTDPKTREAHLIDGDAASGVSHTGKHLSNVVLKIMREIGTHLFSAIVCDSTGNTTVCREDVHTAIPTVIPFGDVCHKQSNTAKDICLLQYFSKPIGFMRQLITFFHHSSFAAQHLSGQRLKLEISAGMVAVGNTRFLSIYYAATASLKCIPAIKELTSNNVVKIKKDTGVAWMKSKKEVRDFEDQLTQLKVVLEPLARSVKCLESLQSTPADVYIFWLAVMASYREMFEKNSDDLDLPNDVIADIRSILNFRYSQMIEGDGAHAHVHLATFFLDYHYIHADILTRRNMNPLSTSVSIRNPTANALAQAPVLAEGSQPRSLDRDLRDGMPAYKKAGAYLVKILVEEIRARTAPDIFKNYEDGEAIVSAFRFQFMCYTRQASPFDRYQQNGQASPMEYWCALEKHPDADVLAHLAIKLFSLVPNSMAEERTVSTFTKLNSPDRSRQKPSTIVAMTMVHQHYRRLTRKPTASSAPVVRFRDLSKYLDPTPGPGPEPVPSAPVAVVPASTAGTSSTNPVDALNPDVPVAQREHSEGGSEGIEDTLAELEHCGDEDDSWGHKGHTASRVAFELEAEEGINLAAPLLRDLLSDEPVTGAVKDVASTGDSHRAKHAKPKTFNISSDVRF